MKEPEWLIKAVVLAMQEEQLAEHGGQPGVRDEGLLDSALDRPKNQFCYGTPDIYDLAAAYAYGISKNHPFLDGNKRASFVVSETFLLLNGFTVTATEEAKLTVWLALADGKMAEAELAKWFRNNAHEDDNLEAPL
ncbi:MAG: type II toxin-antitoxin system death-on-curing family toxin [Beijerinckiaceae bacterium]